MRVYWGRFLFGLSFDQEEFFLKLGLHDGYCLTSRVTIIILKVFKKIIKRERKIPNKLSSLVTCQNKVKCLGEGIKKAIKQKAQLKKALWLEGLLMRHMFLPVSISFERLEHPCLLFSDRLSTDGNSTVLSALVGPENVTCICFKQQTNVFAQDSSRHCWVILGFTWEPLFLPLRLFQHGIAGVRMCLF